MKAFANLFMRLEQTSKPEEKILAWVDYLGEAEDADKLWAIALFSGKRPRRIIPGATLEMWAMSVEVLPAWLVEASHAVVGDKNETIALMLPNPEDGERHGLSEWMKRIHDLQEDNEHKKRGKVHAWWEQMLPIERFIFNKLVAGGFRTVIPSGILAEAIAHHTGLELSVVSHRLMESWSPENTTFHELFFSENPADTLSRPYPFHLGINLEEKPHNLGKESEWVAEWKWDGIRVQVIKRSGEWFLWSRGDELITGKFPELEDLKGSIPDGTAIDAMLVLKKSDKVLSLAMLEARMRKKTLTKKMLKESPAHLIACDLLEWGGKDIREKGFEERQKLLAQLTEKINQPDLLSCSEIIEFDSWDALEELHGYSRDHNSTGLVLKQIDSIYQEGRKNGLWQKWKAAPLTLDAVLIYVQRGPGGWDGTYSEFTFAVWDEEVAIPFAKVNSGLTKEEINEIDVFVKNNIIDRFGPVRSIKPQLVFEISFEDISPSSRHKSGVTVRLPHIQRWKKGKDPKEANTLADLHEILNQIGL